MDAPRHQHREYSVAPRDSILNDFAVVRSSRNDCHASFERIEFRHAGSAADTNDFVAAAKRVLHHISPELS